MSILNADTLNCQSITGASGTVTSTGLVTVNDSANGLTIRNSVDNTKLLRFDLSGCTTGTATSFIVGSGINGTLTLPPGSDTIATLSAPQTLLNKTFGSNISFSSNPVEFGTGTYGLSTAGSVALGVNAVSQSTDGVAI